MKKMKHTALASLLALISSSAIALPNITLLATGGTIAGGGQICNRIQLCCWKSGY